MHFTIGVLRASKGALKRINELRLVLTPNSREVFTRERLATLWNSGHHLIAATASSTFPVKHLRHRIIGMGVLLVCDNVSSRFGVIHTMVVDPEAGGHGVATEILQMLIAIAREQKLEYLDLTSAEHREKAIRMYVKAGFKNLPKNYFRLDFRESPRPS